jgi:hypothetical protein
MSEYESQSNRYDTPREDSAMSTPLSPVGVEFVDELPPATKRGRKAGESAHKYEALYFALVANAGKWAKFRTYPATKKGQASAHTYARNAKIGKVKYLTPELGIEVALRRVSNEYQLFARYLEPQPEVEVLDGLDFVMDYNF